MGVGHLVGISVGAAMFLGLVVGWWVLLPFLTAAHPIAGGAETWASTIFSADVRFFGRSEEHTSELQSLMRISYAVFCLKKKKQQLTVDTELEHAVNSMKDIKQKTND